MFFDKHQRQAQALAVVQAREKALRASQEENLRRLGQTPQERELEDLAGRQRELQSRIDQVAALERETEEALGLLRRELEGLRRVQVVMNHAGQALVAGLPGSFAEELEGQVEQALLEIGVAENGTAVEN